MSKTIWFLDALKKELPNMFDAKDGAPLAEFWESFDAAYQEAAAKDDAIKAAREVVNIRERENESPYNLMVRVDRAVKQLAAALKELDQPPSKGGEA